ncbi:ABC transporter substrate-binding protein [Cypionkella sp.]|uniref:ABC transporter substrate-binding protein n=1 Tax=Cypionkella sp. TaxID=2811411 RepID=UPI00261A97DB|nr:ABC transporter substrate-binding protein [Cypionkella sp.]MDB5665703.1 ddpA 1 [Cypionkella sp.]
MPHSLDRRTLLKMLTAATALPLVMAAPRLAFAATGDLVVRADKDITNLDPANRTSVVEGNILRACAQNLARFKPNVLEWEPDAAKSLVQVSETEITFELNPGQMFSGGYGEMTAEDVKFSFERFLPAADGTKPAYADDWAALDKVEVTGTYTGRILLKNPAPALWLIAICDGSGVIISKKATEALGAAISTTVVGTGPYTMTEWKPNESITLTANPDYKGSDTAGFTRIIIKPVTEFRTALLAYQAGEIAFTEIDPVTIADVTALPDSVVLNKQSIDYTWIGINTQKAPFDNLKVRQALRLGIDMDMVIAGAYSGTVERAHSLMAPGLLGYWADAPVYNRDVAAAQALLAEAGVPQMTATLTCLNDAKSQATAAIVQANLAEIGVAVTINALDGGAYWSMGEGDQSKDLELTLITYGGKFDPSFQTQWFTGAQVGLWNWQRWTNEEFDSLNEKAGTTTDPDARGPMYVRMQELLDESASCLWITHGAKTFVHSKTLVPALLPNGADWQLRFFHPA